MIYVLIITAFLFSVILSAVLIPRILVVAYRKRLFDVPDERKVHKGIVPRLGGLSFVPTILFSLSFVTAIRYLIDCDIDLETLPVIVPQFFLLICGLVLLFLSGIKDDLVGVRYRTKFVIQFFCASLFPLSGLWINDLYGLLGINELSPWIGMPITVLVVVFITNAINLIDGIDGLASGLSSVALVVFSILFIQNELWVYAMLSIATLGVLLPFFYYNVFGNAENCRKIFMGDTGSLTLGYILAFLAVRYVSYEPEMALHSEGAIVVAFSTLIVPMFDVIRVVLVRARTHKNPFKPDKNHIHHKFLAMGFSPRKALITILIMAALFSAINVILVSYVDINLLFFGDIIVWIGLNLWFDWIRDNYKKQSLCKNKQTYIGHKK